MLSTASFDGPSILYVLSITFSLNKKYFLQSSEYVSFPLSSFLVFFVISSSLHIIITFIFSKLVLNFSIKPRISSILIFDDFRYKSSIIKYKYFCSSPNFSFICFFMSIFISGILNDILPKTGNGIEIGILAFNLLNIFITLL